MKQIPKYMAKKLFDDIDDMIMDYIKNMPDELASINGVYQLIMTLISSLMHKHCDLLACGYIAIGATKSKREIFLTLIDELSISCKKGYDAFEEQYTIKH